MVKKNKIKIIKQIKDKREYEIMFKFCKDVFKNYWNCINRKMLLLPAILLMLSSHWISTHLYVNICAPIGISGFLRTMIGLGSPMCGVLLHVQYKTAEYYSFLLLISGLAIINILYSLCIINIKNKERLI